MLNNWSCNNSNYKEERVNIWWKSKPLSVICHQSSVTRFDSVQNWKIVINTYICRKTVSQNQTFNSLSIFISHMNFPIIEITHSHNPSLSHDEWWNKVGKVNCTRLSFFCNFKHFSYPENFKRVNVKSSDHRDCLCCVRTFPILPIEIS